MPKGEEVLGKGQQLCRITKHFSWERIALGSQQFCRLEAERKNDFLRPSPGLAKSRRVQLVVKSRWVWYHAR